jgi:hypothetical protein
MRLFHCPSCGASLSEGSEMCSVCKTSIDWEEGQPVVATAGSAFQRVVILIFIAVVAAALVLAAALIVISNS